MTSQSEGDSGPGRLFLDNSTSPTLTTLVVVAATAALSMNFFLPSLPSMASFFSVDYALMQVAVSGYLGVTAVLQLIMGPLSDRYGRRPVLLASMGIFIVATVGCALSKSAEAFLFFRMMQAAVASGIALARASVRDTLEPDKAASLLSYVTMGMALGPMLGPVAGGVLEQWYGWQSTFWALLLIGALALLLIWFDFGETNQHMSSSFSEQFRQYPALFRSRRFWGYALTAAFASGAFFAFLGGAPYVARSILGMSPASLGFYIGLISVGYAVGNFISGRKAAEVGLNRMMLVGTFVASFGLILSSLLFMAGLYHPLSLFAPVMFVGLGNGLTMPSSNIGMLSVRPHLAGSASGLGGALMVAGGAALAATTGALMGHGWGVWPLLFMMLAASVGASVTALYVIHVEHIVQREADEAASAV
jgi:DHA1 family bicyclomycin/chloramphenicol resistance-like MFS transporter